MVDIVTVIMTIILKNYKQLKKKEFAKILKEILKDLTKLLMNFLVHNKPKETGNLPINLLFSTFLVVMIN